MFPDRASSLNQRWRFVRRHELPRPCVHRQLFLLVLLAVRFVAEIRAGFVLIRLEPCALFSATGSLESQSRRIRERRGGAYRVSRVAYRRWLMEFSDKR